MKQFKATKREVLRKVFKAIIFFYGFIILSLIILLVFDPELSISNPNTFNLAFSILAVFLVGFSSVRSIRKKILVDESYVLTIDDNIIRREIKGTTVKSILKTDITYITKNTLNGFTLYGTGDYHIYIPSYVGKSEELLKELIIIKALEEKIEPFKIEFENQNESFVGFLQRHFKSKDSNLIGLAVSSGGIILLTIIHLYFYFNLFEVKIYNYLNVEENVLSFMNIWKECVFTFIFFAIFLWKWEGLKLRIAKGKRLITGTVFLTILFSLGIISMLYMMHIGISIVPNDKTPAFNSEKLFFIFIVFNFCILPLSWLTVIVYFINLGFYRSEKPVSPLLTFAIAISFALALIFFENYLSYKLLINGYPKVELTLFRSDKTRIIQTNPNVVFIGETRDYLFFYDIALKKTTAINRSSVESEERVLLRKGL
jgi:hypothetical protein